MINPELFLMKNRARKKWIIYKRLFHLVFDFTSLFYVLLVVGYFFIAVIAEGNVAQTFDTAFIQLEAFSVENFWRIVTIIPLFYFLRAFQQPGVTFSSGEYLLTTLPNRTGRVWLIAAIVRWVKSLFVFLIGGTVLYLFSPTSSSFIAAYVCTLLFLNITMTIVEWKFFQQHVFKKLAIFVLVIALNIVSVIASLHIIGIAFIITLIIYNMIAIPKLFTKVDWQKVTAASDFKLWNMVIVSQATKVKYKKDRQYNVWQRLAFWKRPFQYKTTAVYNRLWHLYIEKNIRVILQIVGSLLLLLTVLLFIKNSLFLVAVVLTIHIYTSLAVSMFHDRLVTDIVEVLPWDLHSFKNVLLKWLMCLSIVFLIPYAIYAYIHFSYWLILQLIVIVFTFYFVLRLKLAQAVASIDRTHEIKSIVDIVGYGLYILIIFSNSYPYLLIVGCIIIGIVLFSRTSAAKFTGNDTHLP